MAPLVVPCASVRRRRVGYPARTRGEVAEWPKAAPSKAPTRRRRPERTRALRRASVRRRRVGYPARTRGEVAEWLKAAPSKAPTRRRRPKGRARFAARPSAGDVSAILRAPAEKWPSG